MRQMLIQNATAILLQIRQKFITKCVSFFITKCDSFITKCDSYYKLRQLYYNMRRLLQNATFITNYDSIVSFLWICSLMKVYIFAVFLYKSYIWEKSCSWDICENALCQPDCRILNELFLLNKSIKQLVFLHVDTNSQKLKVDRFFFWLCIVKNGHGQSGLWTL